MLIPKFRLEQNCDFVTIHIQSPYANINETEVYVKGKDVIFSSPPYHLRLHLPGKIIENDNSSAKYDCDQGSFTFTFEKVNKGEEFNGLDMITSLLAPKNMKDLNPSLVEVISSASDSGITETEDIENNLASNVLNNNFCYGFANKLAGSFKDLGSEFPNIFELKTPDEISYEDRRKMREEHEDGKFSSDHYLADYFDEELIEPVLTFTAPWEIIANDSTAKIELTDDDVDVLKELPNKEYLLSKSEITSVVCNMIDVLFAYCYEKRTTYNENNVESSWTINRLSATLSWFETFSDIHQTLICCYRRALVYPMYRNFILCERVKSDVSTLFKIGRKYVVKCLIEIYKLFNSSQDARYILNQLYIRDFLIFSQRCDESIYREAYEGLDQITITKASLHLELEEYEEAGRMVKSEESQILENTLALEMSSLKLLDRGTESKHCVLESDEDSSSSDSSSDSSDTASSSSDSRSDLDSDDDSDTS